MKKPHFLVDFDPSSSSEVLKIPSKFIKHIDGTKLGIASLLGPSGNTWHANLVQQSDDFFFQNGWDAFVSDHFLEHGDSLVFRHDGDLHFTVQIFDRSSCEKEAAFSSKCTQDSSNYDKHTLKRRDRENSALLESIIDGIPKRLRSSQLYSECIAKGQEHHKDLGYKNGFLGEEAGSLGQRSQTQGFLIRNDNSSSVLRDNVTIAVSSHEHVAIKSSEATTGNRAREEELLLSASEAERVARSFTSPFPNFTKVMKRFNISGSYTLNIPYQFATAHLPKCKVKIVLHNLKGESWIVNSIPTTRVQTSHTFCGGWLSFVRSNNINMGDVCIFELVHKCELRVHIIRVIKEGMEDCSQKVMVSSSCGMPKKTSRRKTKKINVNSPNESLQWMKKVDKRGNDHDKVKCVSSFKSRELVMWEASSQDRLGSHTKGCVSMKSAPEEKVAAQSFVSSYPHFVRIMKKFNVSGSFTLKIPYQFATEYLPNCRTEIILRNLKGKCWTVNSIPTTKVQTLHTFCGGWMAFVRDNDIQMGDICIFELVGKQEMRVHISSNGEKMIDCQTVRGSNSIGSLTSSRSLA